MLLASGKPTVHLLSRHAEKADFVPSDMKWFKMATIHLPGVQGSNMVCTYLQELQGFIVGFFTEMFGDLLGMPWRSR